MAGGTAYLTAGSIVLAFTSIEVAVDAIKKFDLKNMALSSFFAGTSAFSLASSIAKNPIIGLKVGLLDSIVSFLFEFEAGLATKDWDKYAKEMFGEDCVMDDGTNTLTIPQKFKVSMVSMGGSFLELFGVTEDDIKATKIKWDGTIDHIEGSAITGWENIKQDASEKIEEMKTGWEEFKTDTSEKWEELKTKVGEKLEEMKTNVNNFKENAGPIFEDLKTKAVDKFTEIKNGIADKLGSAKDWIKTNFIDKVKENFTSLWTHFSDRASDAWNRIKSSFVNGFNSLLDKIQNISILGQKPFEGLTFRLPAYASGGTVSTGQMFVARENGAELVGRIGNKTTVMNNDQIVSAVSQGVASAVASVMGDGYGQFTIPVYVGGSKIQETMYNLNRRENNIRGR